MVASKHVKNTAASILHCFSGSDIDKELSAKEISKEVDVAISSVNNNLRRLLDAGLIKQRLSGNRDYRIRTKLVNLYSITDLGVQVRELSSLSILGKGNEFLSGEPSLISRMLIIMFNKRIFERHRYVSRAVIAKMCKTSDGGSFRLSIESLVELGILEKHKEVYGLTEKGIIIARELKEVLGEIKKNLEVAKTSS